MTRTFLLLSFLCLPLFLTACPREASETESVQEAIQEDNVDARNCDYRFPGCY